METAEIVSKLKILINQVKSELADKCPAQYKEFQEGRLYAYQHLLNDIVEKG